MHMNLFALRNIANNQFESYKMNTPGEGTPIFYGTFARAADALGNMPYRVAKDLSVVGVNVEVSE